MAAQPRGRPVQPSLARRPTIQPASAAPTSRSSRSAGASSRPIVGQRVLDAHRRALADARARRSRAPRAPSCARTAAGRTAPGRRCAISEKRSGAALEQHVDDRAGPALADQLDRLVEVGAAAPRRLPASRSRPCGGRADAHGLRGAQHARLLDGAVDRHLAGDVDHRREASPAPRTAIASSSCSSLQPASRASSCRWHRAASRCSASGAQVAQQRGLALVARVPLAGERDLVEAEAGLARRCARAARARARSGSARRRRARSARASAASACRGAAPSGSARSRAARRASRRARRGSSGAARRAASAPLSTGSDPSGAVRSSWIWKRLIWVFMRNRRGERSRGALDRRPYP